VHIYHLLSRTKNFGYINFFANIISPFDVANKYTKTIVILFEKIDNKFSFLIATELKFILHCYLRFFIFECF
jgi:hypothetical protein